MQMWDSRLVWQGRHYQNIHGYFRAIAKSEGLDIAPQRLYELALDIEAAVDLDERPRELIAYDEDQLKDLLHIAELESTLNVVLKQRYRSVNANECTGCTANNYDVGTNTCRANADPGTCGLTAPGVHPRGFASMRHADRKGSSGIV